MLSLWGISRILDVKVTRGNLVEGMEKGEGLDVKGKKMGLLNMEVRVGIGKGEMKYLVLLRFID